MRGRAPAAKARKHGAPGAVDCNSRRAVGPTKINYMSGILDTTRPSGAFGGTFSLS